MNVLLTGASRGIGYESAKIFCEKAIDRLCLISRNTHALQALKEECLNISPETEVVLLDKSIAEVSKDAKSLGRLLGEKGCDILINNAGQLQNKPFVEFSDDDVEEVFEVNTFAPLRLLRTLIKEGLLNPSAHIVNIGSMGGFQGSAKFPGLSYYSASKAALSNLTACLAEEYKETGLKFNCLALGAVQTEMLAEAFPGYQAPVSAKDMATYIVDFSMNGGKFYNGQTLPVTLSTP